MTPQPPQNVVWYYALAGETFGPLGKSELLQKAAEGIVKPETLVVEQGGTDWKPFASVPLASESVTPPPLSSATMPGSVQVKPSGEGEAQKETTKQNEGCKNGCIGCFGLVAIWLIFSSIFQTCSKEAPSTKGGDVASTPRQDAKLPYPFTVKEARDYYEMTVKARAGMEDLFSEVISKDEAERGQMDIMPIRDKIAKVQALLYDIRVLFGHDNRLGNVGTFRSELVESLHALKQAIIFLEELRKARTTEAEQAAIRLFNISLEHCDNALNKAGGLVTAVEEGLPAPL